MKKSQPAPHKTYFIDLPLSRLHVLETGQGAPLIMVPATISELENWRTLAQFMAQWFTVYFFELPGHGQSTPFKDGFSSKKVATLISQLADTLGFERFNLMGFSFGGILAMQTYKLLAHRIDRVILIAPCLGQRTLPFPPLRLHIIQILNQLLSNPNIQEKFVALIHNPNTVSLIVKGLQKIGQLEDTLPLQDKLLHTKASTISVLNAQIGEILNTDFHTERDKYYTPCYFAMSVYDPLLDFESAHSILQTMFGDLSTVKLTYPFHQPPVPFTYHGLNRDFYETVDAFIKTDDVQKPRYVSEKTRERINVVSKDTHNRTLQLHPSATGG